MSNQDYSLVLADCPSKWREKIALESRLAYQTPGELSSLIHKLKDWSKISFRLKKIREHELKVMDKILARPVPDHLKPKPLIEMYHELCGMDFSESEMSEIIDIIRRIDIGFSFGAWQWFRNFNAAICNKQNRCQLICDELIIRYLIRDK